MWQVFKTGLRMCWCELRGLAVGSHLLSGVKTPEEGQTRLLIPRIKRVLLGWLSVAVIFSIASFALISFVAFVSFVALIKFVA